MRTGPMLHWLWLSVLVIALDHGTKYLASTMLDYGVPVPVLPSFNLTLAHNTGAAFSFLADASGWQRWFFVAIAVVVSGILLDWLRRLPRHETWTAVSLTLILGGAVGNVIDRVVHGYVVDFIQVYYDVWYWPAFNIADSAITVGVAILLIENLLASKKTGQDAVGEK